MYRLCHEGCHGPLFYLSRVCASFIARSRRRTGKAMAMKRCKTESEPAFAAALSQSTAGLRLPGALCGFSLRSSFEIPTVRSISRKARPKKIPRKLAVLEGAWLMTGCYHLVKGEWIPDMEYLYAPYYEIWEFHLDGSMTHRAYGIELHYRFILSGSVLSATRTTGRGPVSEPSLYRLTAGKKHASLTLFSPVPGGIERRFELIRLTGRDKPFPPKTARRLLGRT